ncbi:MAG: SUMF1/EgtB/PvdO family nonheme iron enzyme [Planctomycetes bacterium]|nr:SUMF1/EgtB/PvdO family nonheme iron enzyme [Planctomycetota bacterium]
MKAWSLVVLAAASIAAAQEEPLTREVGKMRARRPVSAKLQEGDRENFEFGSYHALLIGVQRYEGHEADLRTPIGDVEALAAVLERDYQFEPPTLLRDREATREGILGALDELAQRLDERDSLLIFFAGHGTKRWAGSEHEEGFWVPYLPADAEHRWWNWLSAETLNRATARIRAKHVLLISDSCYSGLLTRDVRALEAVTPNWIRVQHARSSNQVLTSGADEPVADGGRDGHSLFAYHLLDALTHNPDKFLPAATLGDHLVRAVMQDPDFQRARHPQMPLFAPHPLDPRSGGQFVFVRDVEGPAQGERMVADPGMPTGYRRPNHVTVEEVQPGRFRYWCDEGGVRVEMALVRGGTLRRGERAVTVEPFLIDVREVDNARFDRFIDATGATIGLRPGSAAARAATAPATAMSLEEARAFAAWAGNKRLPTQLEWEFAAAFDPERRVVTTYPWGDQPLPDLPRQTAPQGPDPRDVSPFGVAGMGGSVRELCEVDAQSWSELAPRGVVRGGTQVVSRRAAVDASVGQALPVEATARREGEVGFRCVKSLIPPYRQK